MTKTKSTKRALLSSALALLICVSMLIGSTFAWFTDSVASAGNIIKSGTLEVTMEWKDATATGKQLTYKDASEGAIFNYDLWEPGYVEAKNVKISNVGTLALKYKLNILANGEVSDLANVIDVYFAEGEYTLANRDMSELKLIGTLNEVLKGMPANVSGDLEANTADTVTIALKMQESAGNEYQGLAIGSDFSIQLLATQLASEFDSFGNDYDANAPISVWDGTVDTSWYNADADSYELGNPAKLAGLAQLVNNGNNFAGKSIKLAADMDLNDLKWTAIGTETAKFNGKFYGNGYTIYNLNVSGTKGVGLIGFAGNAAHIEGVHIVGANVVGENSVGAVLGYGYLAPNCLKHCVVENAFVLATAGEGKEDGDKVGAVAGWTSNGNIIGNKAINCEIYGCRDIGGIVGYVNGENRAVKVSENTVENVTVRVIDVEGYTKDLGSNINAAVGKTGNAVTVKSNNGNIVKKVDVPVVSTNEDLKETVKGGGEVVVFAGNYTFPASGFAEDTVLICAPGTVFEGTSKLNIEGSTVVGATFSNPTGTAADQKINGTFKDCTFSGANGLRWCYAGETVVFENCVFDGSTYGVHFDGGANDVMFKDCTFSGFNAFGAAVTKLTLDGCTFVANGKSNYNGINMYGNTDLIDCTFIFDGTAGNEWVDLCSNNKTVTFTNCVVTDGTTEKGIETVVGDYGVGNTIIIDGVYYVASADDISTAISNGATNITLAKDMTLVANNLKDASSDLTVTLADDTTVTVASGAAASKNLTFTGDKSSTVVLVNTNPGYEGALAYHDNANLTFKGITFDANQISGICARGGVVTFIDCNITGELEKTIASKFVFSGCTFDVGVTQVGYGCSDVVFEGCDFETDGYGIKIYSEGNTPVNLTVKNCAFKSTNGDVKSAIFLDHIINGITYNITVDNCTFAGYTATPTASYNKWAERMIVTDSFVKTADGQYIFSYQTGAEGGSYYKPLSAQQLVVTVK